MVNENWTLEEAIAANELALTAMPGRSASDPTLPLFQWFALSKLQILGQKFEHDSYLLMTAIRICANHDLPLPEWASKAYVKAYDEVNNARKKTWDEVFGKPYAKGRNLNAIRKKRTCMFAVLNAVNAELQANPSTAIDAALFETVGKQFNIGKTLAGEYYYAAKGVLENGRFTHLLITGDAAEIETPKTST